MKCLVEIGCPPGHVNWIGSVLERAREERDPVCLVTYRDYRSLIPGAERHPFLSLGRSVPRPTNKVIRRLVHYRALHRAMRLTGGSPTLFLSYDPWVMLGLHLYRGREVSAFEHNNVDRAEDSWLYRLPYRALPKNLTHICFASYIGEHIGSTYGMATDIWAHGVRTLQADPAQVAELKTILGAFCFSPTACSEPDVVKVFADRAEREGLSLHLRAPYGREAEYVALAPNIHLAPRDIDYDAYLAAAHTVGIMNRYEYRVSGVFYEALGTGARIWMRQCRFSEFAVANHSDFNIEVLAPGVEER